MDKLLHTVWLSYAFVSGCIQRKKEWKFKNLANLYTVSLMVFI